MFRKIDLACKSASITLGEFCCTAVSEKSVITVVTEEPQPLVGELGSGGGPKNEANDAQARHQPLSKWIDH